MTVAFPETWHLRPGALSHRTPTRFDLRPDATLRAALAAEIGIDAITALRFHGEVRPSGRQDLTLDATLTATAVQPCVVTMAPVTTRVSESVIRRYIQGLVPPAGDEVEVPEDVTEEPLPPVIDLGAVIAEALLLALPLYPRATGADFDGLVHAAEGVTPLRDDDLKPFAGLSSLAGRLFGADPAKAEDPPPAGDTSGTAPQQGDPGGDGGGGGGD